MRIDKPGAQERREEDSGNNEPEQLNFPTVNTSWVRSRRSALPVSEDLKVFESMRVYGDLVGGIVDLLPESSWTVIEYT